MKFKAYQCLLAPAEINCHKNIFVIYFSFTHPIQDITVGSDLSLIRCEPDPNVVGLDLWSLT